MEKYYVQIVIEIIQNLSWPITILLLALIFKEPLKRLSKIKINDYEIELKNEIDALSKVTKNNKSKGDWKVTSTAFLKENMLELAEKSPLAVILQSWDILESMIIDVTKTLGNYEKYTVGAILQDLYEKKYLEKRWINLYYRIYVLKTKMCNFENEKVTKARAIELADTILSIGSDIVEEINKRKR